MDPETTEAIRLLTSLIDNLDANGSIEGRDKVISILDKLVDKVTTI